jgi:hypothetical protein
MKNSTKRALCCRLFQYLDIFPIQLQYILSISMFVIVNKELFTFNLQVHNCNLYHVLYCIVICIISILCYVTDSISM